RLRALAHTSPLRTRDPSDERNHVTFVSPQAWPPRFDAGKTERLPGLERSTSSEHVAARIADDRLAGDRAALVAREEHRQIRDVVRTRDIAQSRSGEKLRPVGVVIDVLFGGGPANPGAPQFGIDAAGNDAVAANALGADLVCNRLREGAKCSFRGD